jgi:hypothetical protein
MRALGPWGMSTRPAWGMASLLPKRRQGAGSRALCTFILVCIFWIGWAGMRRPSHQERCMKKSIDRCTERVYIAQ